LWFRGVDFAIFTGRKHKVVGLNLSNVLSPTVKLNNHLPRILIQGNHSPPCISLAVPDGQSTLQEINVTPP